MTAPAAQQAPAYTQLSPEEVLSHNNEVANDFHRRRLCTTAAKHWDRFYQNNANHFFKDRHWTYREFFQDARFDLASESIHVVCEVGCGTGSFVYPLLEERPDLVFHACDFSRKAIEQVRKHEAFTPKKIHAFVHDITSTAPTLMHRLREAVFDPSPPVSHTQADLLSSIFVLSAISPEEQPGVVFNLLQSIRVGGFFVFRDYALHDAAQLRLHMRKSHAYSDPNLLDSDKPFYARSDQTLTYFFTPEEVSAMVEAPKPSHDALRIGAVFSDPKFERLQCEVIERDLGNRKEGWEVKRKFIQGVWRRIS